VTPNAQGGYNGYRRGSFTTPVGGSGSSQIRFQTDGQGSATYNGSGTATRATGKSVDYTTSGSANYNQTSGYSGQNTTVVNGNTYSSSTQNGTTTITAPNGTRTYTRSKR